MDEVADLTALIVPAMAAAAPSPIVLPHFVDAGLQEPGTTEQRDYGADPDN